MTSQEIAHKKVLNAIKRHRQLLDFTKNNLGNRLCDAFMIEVKSCIDSGRDTKGRPWPSLSAAYNRWKQRKFPGVPMGSLMYTMTSSYRGVRDIKKHKITLEFAQAGSLQAIHASLFQEGDRSQNRPKRKFWGFTLASLKSTKTLISNTIKRGI